MKQQHIVLETGVYAIDDDLKSKLPSKVFIQLQWHRDIDKTETVTVSHILPTSVFVVNARIGLDFNIAIPTDSESGYSVMPSPDAGTYIRDGMIHYEDLPAGSVVFDCWRDDEGAMRLHMGLMPEQSRKVDVERARRVLELKHQTDFAYDGLAEAIGYPDTDCVMCGKPGGSVRDDGKAYHSKCWMVWNS